VTRYRVSHETKFTYGEPVVTSHNEARLRPRGLARQTLITSRLDIDPVPKTVVWRQDYFGNDVVFFELEKPHDELVVVASSEVEVSEVEPPSIDRSPAWEEVALAVMQERSDLHIDALQFVFDSTSVRRSGMLADYAAASFPPGERLLSGVNDLRHRIFSEFRYDQEATTVATPLEEVFENRRGVCQDFAHVMIGCLRSLGLPGRYVSGYVRPNRVTAGGTAPAPGPEIVGGGASHAWLSVFDGEQWVEIDPTNDLVVSDQHVVLAWGRDYDDVSPVRGVTLGGRGHAVAVEVSVEVVQ
jgi:transglutaminase-like putative cysteine protease